MAEKVMMPKLEMAQETGKLIEWLKEEGERVEKGDPLFVIETDKVTIEIESPASGVLSGVRAHPGDEVPISTIIAYLLEPGEELPEEASEVVSGFDRQASASPNALRLAESLGLDLREVVGTGPEGQVTEADVQEFLEALGVENIRLPPRKVRATSDAHRLAQERGIDLTSVKGSGPGGRIEVKDVEEATSVPIIPQLKVDRIIPLEGMRRTIANRMMASYQAVPHIAFTVRVDMGNVEEARERFELHAQAEGFPHLSITSIIVKATAMALERQPLINSTLKDEKIYVLSDINIGVAVALEEGLIAPVVHHADQKDLLEIATEVNDLVTRARKSQLTLQDVSGATFTISNLGPFGVEHFSAIINPPQTAVLAVGAIQSEVVPDDAGQLLVRPLMRMTLSADHRVVDGALAAHFLADIREAIEKPGFFPT
jgi:pyruvate dehydrogenase E2 component (dihydrolipoamide acetyltransferase)